jgi:hypothetical protein
MPVAYKERTKGCIVGASAADVKDSDSRNPPRAQRKKPSSEEGWGDDALRVENLTDLLCQDLYVKRL